MIDVIGKIMDYKRFALAAVVIIFLFQFVRATQTDIVGPAGSGQFGTFVTVLPNGNFVVTDPLFDDPGGTADVGAVYLYSGNSLTLISTLKGSSAGDRIGFSGVTVLINGNFVVNSIFWDNPSGQTSDAGAVTFCSQVTGCNGIVSAVNSLVGSSVGDRVGSRINALTNGHYVVSSQQWRNGSAPNAGAATWCDGTVGRSGAVTAANSLVGTTTNDNVGFLGATALSNGNYVVDSPNWNSLTASSVGAVTWGNGMTGTTGIVSAANSLVGSTTDDMVGNPGIVALTNGNYVVRSSVAWDNGAAINAGAITWGNGNGGTVGVVSSTNSLVGSTSTDRVGGQGVTPLSNGNYVVASTSWDNPANPGTLANSGAVTWGNGVSGTSGAVSLANSFTGTMGQQSVGEVTPLKNGNYVISDSNWLPTGSRLQGVGAATWCSGLTGCTGNATSGNSLIGTQNNDVIGSGGAIALSNGDYVSISSYWHDPALSNAAVGAATWCTGAGGCTGPVSAANSMTGIGAGSAVALTNGNYVLFNLAWDDPSLPGDNNVGAVTWCGPGATGTISAGNSLIGSSVNDLIGSDGVTALANGNYAVRSSNWDNGPIQNVGAVTWASGSGSSSFSVSASNSIVGGSTNDFVGRDYIYLSPGVMALPDGNYVVQSGFWDNPSGLPNVGAITFCKGTGGTVGSISSNNSILGTVNSGLPQFSISYDTAAKRLYVGQLPLNIVTIIEQTRVTVDGRVLTSDGRGLRNATVAITDPQGVVRTATTSSFGFFSFDQVLTGAQYTIAVRSRLYRYQPQTVQVNGSLTLPDFVGLE